MGSSSDRRKITPEGNWNIKNGRRTKEIVNIWVHIIDYSSPLEFFKT